MAIQRESMNSVPVVPMRLHSYWSFHANDPLTRYVWVRHGDIFGHMTDRQVAMAYARMPKPVVRVYPIPAGTNQGTKVRRLALTGPDRRTP